MIRAMLSSRAPGRWRLAIDATAERSSTRALEGVGFAVILVISTLLSAFWAFRVPIFEQPDESAHFDYAISIATAHRLILAREGVPGTDVHPFTRYLEDATNFRDLHYNADGRAPRSYGSSEFYRHLDAGAPPAVSFDPAAVHKMPLIVMAYPFGFYAIEALVMNLAALVTHGSLSAMFFAARLFCVAL